MPKRPVFLFLAALAVLSQLCSPSRARETEASSPQNDPLGRLISLMHSGQWKQLNATKGAGQPLNALSPFTIANYDGLPAQNDAWDSKGVQLCATAGGPTPCGGNDNIFSYSAPAIRPADGKVCALQTGGHAASGYSGVLCFDTEAAASCLVQASGKSNPINTPSCGTWKEMIHPATFVRGWHPLPAGSPQVAPTNTCQATWLNGVNFIIVAPAKPRCLNFPAVYIMDEQSACFAHATYIPNININLTATASLGSSTLTALSPDPQVAGVYNGMVISGAGIPANTVVNTVTSSTVTMMDQHGNPVAATVNSTKTYNFRAAGDPPIVTLAKNQPTTCAQATPVTLNFGCEVWATPNKDGITVAPPAHNYYSNKSIPGTTKWTAGNGPNGSMTIRGCGPLTGGATLYDDATNVYQTNIGYPDKFGPGSNGFAGTGYDGFTVAEAYDDLTGCLVTHSGNSLIKYCENADGTGAPVDGNFHKFTLVNNGPMFPADYVDALVFAPPWAPTQRWWFQFQKFNGGIGPYSCYDLAGHQTFKNGCFNLWKDIDGTPTPIVQEFATPVLNSSRGGGQLSNGICWNPTVRKILYAAGTQHIYQINVNPDVDNWSISEFTSHPTGDVPIASESSGEPAALGCLQPKYDAELLVVGGQVYIYKN